MPASPKKHHIHACMNKNYLLWWQSFFPLQSDYLLQTLHYRGMWSACTGLKIWVSQFKPPALPICSPVQSPFETSFPHRMGITTTTLSSSQSISIMLKWDNATLQAITYTTWRKNTEPHNHFKSNCNSTFIIVQLRIHMCNVPTQPNEVGFSLVIP